jgi:HSP20 family protein
LSNEKKKMHYYYGGKEKKAGEIKKEPEEEEITPYFQRDFDRMMEQFQREFDEFWTRPRWGHHWRHHGYPLMPYEERMTMPSVDLEDEGKNYCLIVDLPGFRKEDVDVQVTDDSVTVHAEKTREKEEKRKNYVRQERASQTYYRRIRLPEPVLSSDAKANLKDGVLQVDLPKKQSKETKKLTVT